MGSSLFTLVKTAYNQKLPEKEAKSIFRQVVEGLCFIKSKGIAHRDIKAENILVNCGEVKLIDFGFSIYVEDTSELIETFCGTPTYMSP